MLIPSIDIMRGRAVQLVNGRGDPLDCGDPRELAERFSILGEIAVIDLDAALGTGSNADLVTSLARDYPCRVGGGLRDEAAVARMLDAGAATVILGTRAAPDFMSRFPKERLVAAVDVSGADVMTHGWTTASGRVAADAVVELAPYCGAFMFTDIRNEGTLRGLDRAWASETAALAKAAGVARVTIAGGVADESDIAFLDSIGADAQVGMALYTGIVDPARALAACLRSDRPDGLWPTVVCDERGIALGLAYSDAESLARALGDRKGVYRSRTRGLWIKGATSGAAQTLLRVDADCDRDALRFVVRQDGAGFCHEGSRTCFARGGDASRDPASGGVGALDRVVASRLRDGGTPGSYTRRLKADPALLAAKLREETEELIEAETPERAAEEAADLLYFLSVRLAAAGSSIEAAERVLDRRALGVTRRPGDAKPGFDRAKSPRATVGAEEAR